MMDDHENGQVANPSTDHRLEDGLTPEQKEGVYAHALRRARMRMGLRVHATIFVLVIPLLAVINLLTTPKTLWVVWPFLGWGIGFLLHWLFAAKLAQVYENIKTEEIARELEHRRPSQAGM